jgi:hypothetical protein
MHASRGPNQKQRHKTRKRNATEERSVDATRVGTRAKKGTRKRRERERDRRERDGEGKRGPNDGCKKRKRLDKEKEMGRMFVLKLRMRGSPLVPRLLIK